MINVLLWLIFLVLLLGQLLSSFANYLVLTPKEHSAFRVLDIPSSRGSLRIP